MQRVFRASDANNYRFGDRRIINATNSAINARGLNPDLGFENENSRARNRKVGTGRFAEALRAATGGGDDKFHSSMDCVLGKRLSHYQTIETAGSTPAHAA